MPNIQPSSRLQRPWRSCLHDPEGDHAFDGMSKGASSLARASMDCVDAPYARDRASMDAVLAPRPCTRASMDAACGRESTTRTSMAFVLPRSRRNRACAVSKNEPARRVLASMDGVDAAARCNQARERWRIRMRSVHSASLRLNDRSCRMIAPVLMRRFLSPGAARRLGRASSAPFPIRRSMPRARPRSRSLRREPLRWLRTTRFPAPSPSAPRVTRFSQSTRMETSRACMRVSTSANNAAYVPQSQISFPSRARIRASRPTSRNCRTDPRQRPASG